MEKILEHVEHYTATVEFGLVSSLPFVVPNEVTKPNSTIAVWC